MMFGEEMLFGFQSCWLRKCDPSSRSLLSHLIYFLSGQKHIFPNQSWDLFQVSLFILFSFNLAFIQYTATVPPRTCAGIKKYNCQCSGSVLFWYGSWSLDPYTWSGSRSFRQWLPRCHKCVEAIKSFNTIEEMFRISYLFWLLLVSGVYWR
jgi:hypothetical protein